MSRQVTAEALAILGMALVTALAGTPGRVCAQRSASATESYEQQRMKLFLSAAKLEEDPEPEGKSIEYVRLERREVFEPDDLLVPIILPRFASTWPNAFHWLTRESRIQRELLLHQGQRYSQQLAEETMRNLRALWIIALVEIVPVKTADPARVGVIVYTRDIWSLRAEQSFAGAGNTFALGGQLVERNFLGRGEWLAIRGSVDPLRFSVGQTFTDPRFLGRELSVYEAFDLIWNRASLQTEGSTGTLSIGRPFYNLAQRTAYRLYAFYADYIFRDTRAGEVVGYNVTPAQRGQVCVVGSDECLARVWHDQSLQVEASSDYRVGVSSKHTFTIAGVAHVRNVAATAETGLRPGEEALFKANVLPKVRRDIYPYMRYRLALPDFAVLTNLSTFGLSESVNVGPSVDGLIGVPLRAYGASSDGLILHGVLGYVWSQHDALIDFAAEGFSRLESGRVVDQRGILRVRGASPELPALFGRFVLRAYWDARRYDTQRTFVSLGGDNGLRGFPAQEFYAFGARRILSNVEYRSHPWLLQSVHLGAVLFYDVGAVYRRLAIARFHHNVGAGVRLLFPQLNRTVFRFDVGVPLATPGISAQLSYGSEQFVPLTATEDQAATADQSTSVRQSL